MLSVLIPTYDYKCFFLAQEIHQQLILENILFEIICFDDGSKSQLNLENEKINTLHFASFTSLENNIGRSAIRNLLAKKAQYKWLLFLDADVVPVHANFIKKYTDCFQKKNTIFCGGLLYQNKKENFELLRYKYGKKHEEVSVEKRKKNAEKYFFTSNFLIEKAVFDAVCFEEKLKQYGREDLLFSIELIKKEYKIDHLENEVFHIGIEENRYFVSKTKKAMENLVYIERQQLIKEEEIDILNFVKKIKKLKMMKIAGSYYTFFEKLAIKKSSVFYFNCMKVCYVCHLKSMHE